MQLTDTFGLGQIMIIITIGGQISTIVEASVGQEFACAMSDSYSNPSNAGIFYLWFSAYMVG